MEKSGSIRNDIMSVLKFLVTCFGVGVAADNWLLSCGFTDKSHLFPDYSKPPK